MRSLIHLLFGFLAICTSTYAQEQQPAGRRLPQGEDWTQEVQERAKRGTLHDAFQHVRGDSGKWNDDPRLQAAPAMANKPRNTSLDDWADRWLEQDFQLTSNDDSWLVLRTRQLDDNDRVWVERIERHGNEFTIVLSEAIWQGRYFKTFTYYGAFGLNLGKLEPGQYKARCIIRPLAFTKFEDPGMPMNNWPKDERPADKKPVELRLEFTVNKG